MTKRKARIDKAAYDALDAAGKDFYRAEGTHFVLDVEPTDGWDLQDVAGLRSIAQDRTERHKKLQEKFALIPEEVKPEDIVAALEFKKSYDPTKMVAKDHLEQAVAQIKNEHKTKQEEGARERKILAGEIERLLVDTELQRILSLPESKGSFDLLIEPVRKRTRVVQDKETGKFSVQVLDVNGNPAFSRKDNKTYAGLQEFVTDDLMKSDQYGRAFDSYVVRGANTPAGGAGAAGGGNNGYTLKESEAQNPIVYQAARAKAEAAGARVQIVPD